MNDPRKVTRNAAAERIRIVLRKVGANPNYIDGYIDALRESGPLRADAPRWILVSEYCRWLKGDGRGAFRTASAFALDKDRAEGHSPTPVGG